MSSGMFQRNTASALAEVGTQRRQRGAFTVVMVSLLVVAALVVSLGISKNSLFAVRMSANAQLADESFNAAEIALIDAIEGLSDGSVAPSWSSGNKTDWSDAVTGSNVTFKVKLGSGSSADFDRSYSTLYRFREAASGGKYLQVWARARGDGGAVSSVSQWVVRNTLLVTSDLDVPPLLVGGCVEDMPGNVSIDSSDKSSAASHAITYAVGGSETTCTAASKKTGKNGFPYFEAGLNKQAGKANAPDMDSTVVVATSVVSGDLWSYLFSEDRSTVQNLAATQANLHWVSAGETPPESAGTPSSPAVVVLNSCERLKGDYYGLIFYDVQGAANCELNGNGNVTVHGAIVVNGQLEKLNANIVIRSLGSNATPGSASDLDNIYGSQVAVLPGTWSDLETP